MTEFVNTRVCVCPCCVVPYDKVPESLVQYVKKGHFGTYGSNDIVIPVRVFEDASGKQNTFPMANCRDSRIDWYTESADHDAWFSRLQSAKKPVMDKITGFSVYRHGVDNEDNIHSNYDLSPTETIHDIIQKLYLCEGKKLIKLTMGGNPNDPYVYLLWDSTASINLANASEYILGLCKQNVTPKMYIHRQTVLSAYYC